MCPLRYILVALSVLFALFVVIGGAAYAPEFLIEVELKRKQKNRKWYQTLWDFAWGKFLIDLWNESVNKEKNKNATQHHTINEQQIHLNPDERTAS
mmetsp:Transcript_47768/g.79251  ORF Transcript_47768/g.79251 Transcript_47768/m.79251 type:complete len:96 (-) Transcript_47768:243-530(-)